MEEVSIQPKHYLTCLWPGMSELWWRGHLSALPAAIAFAAVLNALLIAQFVYSDWLSGGLVMLACWVVIAAWVVLTVRSMRELPLLLTPRQASDEPDRFAEAQIAFLQGDYPAAEDYLNACLAVEPRDPPALLMLSAIYRQTGRLSASQLLLGEIRKLEVAQNWDLEFQIEESRLQRDLDAREDQSTEAEDSQGQDETNTDDQPGTDGDTEAHDGTEGETETDSETVGEDEFEAENSRAADDEEFGDEINSRAA